MEKLLGRSSNDDLLIIIIIDTAEKKLVVQTEGGRCFHLTANLSLNPSFLILFLLNIPPSPHIPPII